MLPEFVVGLVVEALHGGILDRAVHPLDLTIGPWMPRLRQPMFDVEVSASQFKGMAPEHYSLRPHRVDVFRRPPVPGGLGEVRAVAPTERSGLAAESAARAAFKQRGARRSRRSWPLVRISRMRVSKPIPERPTMTKLNPTPDGAVLVGIDIAKIRNEVLIEVAGNARRRRLSVLNTRVEHDRFIALLKAYSKPVICAFEATGNYHRPLAWRLAEAGFEVRLVSSMALARTREALHNSWDKNDPKDAQVVLHMLVGCRRPQGQQDTDSNGHLRDGALIDRTAAAA